jgi:hypothetical protein
VQLRALLRTHLTAQPLRITPSVARRPPAEGYLKTETITDKKYPHEHRGTNVDRETGKIEEFYVGKYADPGGKGRRPIE